MEKTATATSLEKKHQFLALLLNPEALFWPGVLLCGTAAAGWFLIGAGILLALIPVIALAPIWVAKKRRRQ